MTDPLAAAREALAAQPAWLVGGTLRDRLLGRPAATDIDLAVAGEVEAAARAVGRAAGAPAFPLSEAFGAWRVVDREQTWTVDVSPLMGQTIEADLGERDFTFNAMAEPLGGGDLIDPHHGRADLEARRVRMVAPRAFASDPLRVVRVARFAAELGFEAERATVAAAREQAPQLAGVAMERVFAELKRLVVAPAPGRGLSVLEQTGATAAVLPELAALRGVEQNRYHHLDVYHHTLEVLAQFVALESDPAPLGDHAAAVLAVLAEPLADGLTRGGALRFGALLHDVAKPETRAVTPDGHVTFFHHNERGAERSEEILVRLRASGRLRAHVAALARHHLRLGFLVGERPLGPRTVHGYLRACGDVAVDVTVLSVADRLATRGRKADQAIAAHLELAAELLGPALRWCAEGPPAPLIRGDELARELGIVPGPSLGPLLETLEAAQYAGEIATRDEAIALARGRSL